MIAFPSNIYKNSNLQASEVPQGGTTVFPEINVTVFPQKGSMLYWFNLHDDGKPDIRSLHSVCPVLNGDRWSRLAYSYIRTIVLHIGSFLLQRSQSGFLCFRKCLASHANRSKYNSS